MIIQTFFLPNSSNQMKILHTLNFKVLNLVNKLKPFQSITLKVKRMQRVLDKVSKTKLSKMKKGMTFGNGFWYEGDVADVKQIDCLDTFQN
jgi:hypothetical protein